MILTFEGNENDILNQLLALTNAEEVQVFTVSHKPLVFQGLIIDETHRIVLRDENEINLTYREFEILLLLAKNTGRVFSKEQIYDVVWREPYSGDYNIVMKHIRNIREKIEDDPSKPVYIQTVWGVGYRFNKNLSSGL